jgi:hypothetical protein
VGPRRSTTRATFRVTKLRSDHGTAPAFLDETGSISQDRFFAVGCLILPEPSDVVRKIEKLRDKRHWYSEIKWAELTEGTVDLYRDLVEIAATSDARFSCFVADRETADPVERFKRNPWLAYEKLATQLLIGSAKPWELLSVMADKYSTPDNVVFEKDLRAEVNRRLGGLTAVTVCRLDSRSCDPLQLVDVLTGAVTFEFRQNAGLAGTGTPKAKLVAEFREIYGVPTVLGGCKTNKINVAIYRNPSSVSSTTSTRREVKD